jgi:hypothetical protein
MNYYLMVEGRVFLNARDTNPEKREVVPGWDYDREPVVSVVIIYGVPADHDFIN